jgi:hypothetical protein
LLYYAAAVCVYDAWCVFNVHRQDGHVIALEVKISLLLVLMAPFGSNRLGAEDDHG